jgi:hypothetical protein
MVIAKRGKIMLNGFNFNLLFIFKIFLVIGMPELIISKQTKTNKKNRCSWEIEQFSPKIVKRT